MTFLKLQKFMDTNTGLHSVHKEFEQGNDVILEIDWQGANK